MLAFAALLLAALWGAGTLWARGDPRLRRLPAKELLLAGPFLRLFERTNLWGKAQDQLAGLHRKLVILHGTGHMPAATQRFLAEQIGLGYAALSGAALIAWLAGETPVLALGAVLGALLPAVRLRDVHRSFERRRQDMLLALPELLSKLILLVGAGETVTRALVRCASAVSAAERDHPLYRELRRMCNELHNGAAFQLALEGFGKRCAVQEVSIFTTTVLLNYRRGGERFTLSLRELSYTLWEKRKAVARGRGEEASAKLIFPMTVIFFMLMVLVAAPAMLMIG
ncbi:type II secretion system F family protein [Paenibacillus sp. IB182496]|uniref:Type II secretion system F family protein n=1 Tax=Paenibacillus sabuli TaxID=2772509 RepID=A0A927BR00_9BACL|nr:type II secretion system F family protein [Paenibacillus sabuli]MBD2844326.1 type II secretion system F family protein [Paenibacillus sabuli]